MIDVIFSDIDGTCVHYDMGETLVAFQGEGLERLGLERAQFPDGNSAWVLALPESSSGSRGIISVDSLAKYETLRSLGCEFVPLIVERSGAISESVNQFIKNVSNVAHSRKKHNKGFFVHYWTAILANEVFQDVSRMKRRQVRGLIDKASRNVLSNTRIRIQDGHMSSVSAEGRLLA